MDQVANLKSENKELQEAFNYVATDFKGLQKEILEEMRIENTMERPWPLCRAAGAIE
jgi:hypothetical protein